MYLLDINVLIALCDPGHPHHQTATQWFAISKNTGWATSPLTENGFLRILSHPKYPGDLSLTVEDVVVLLDQLIATIPEYQFIPDDESIRRMFADFSTFSSASITDQYLLALCVRHDAIFATFDRRIDCKMIPNGDSHIEVIK